MLLLSRPHCALRPCYGWDEMNSWKPTPRTPAKTKQELREMLAQAVRNTQPETETKPLPKAKKVAAGVAALGAQR